MNLKIIVVVILVSIVILISLFVGLRLLPNSSVISETTKASPTAWSITWTGGVPALWILQNVNATFSGDITFTPNVRMEKFDENTCGFEVSANGTLEHGYIYGVNVTFWESDNYSSIEYDTDPFSPLFSENLSIGGNADLFQNSGLKAFFALAGENQPKDFYFKRGASWNLDESPFSKNYQLEVDVAVTYYNGTIFKEAIQPLQLTISPVANTDTATAELLTSGTNYTQNMIGYPIQNEFFNISVTKGDEISILAQGYYYSNDAGPIFQIILNDPEGHTQNSTGYTGAFESNSLSCLANSTGNWTIEIASLDSEYGYYWIQALDTKLS